MKCYSTGKGTISLWALLGIWSVSALTSLPGLAISPISDRLEVIFTGATELDIELLTTLPSLLIIPFILLAGYISERVGYIKLLYIGLSLFLLSGALYFLCVTINELIVVSALLGVGAGIIIPLSTSLVSRFFAGKQRTRQFGYVSAITNIALVVATSVTGWLADIEWRLPFVVYLLPFFSLLLVPEIKRCGRGIEDDSDNSAGSSGGVNYILLLKYMLYYFFITYLVMAVSLNLPFLLGGYGDDSAVVGVVTSLFFLAMMLPGLFINRIITFVGSSRVLVVSLLLIGVGLLGIFFSRSLLFVVAYCAVAGFGYGVAQPYIYDATATLAPSGKSTNLFALVMTMNYVAIVVAPFVIDLAQKVLNEKGNAFPFVFNAILAFVGVVFLFVIRKRKISGNL